MEDLPALETRTIDLDGPVHFLDVPGPTDGPRFVLVHGLGGAHTNWLGLVPYLSRLGHVYVLDLIGFGFTPPAGRRADVWSNRRLVDRFIEEIAVVPVVLVGNSMGGAISIMQAAERPESVSGLVLVAPAVPRALGQYDHVAASFFATYLVPPFGERFITKRMHRIGPERVVNEMMRLCVTDPERVHPELLDAHVHMARARADMPWSTRALMQGARSLVRLLMPRRRFLQMVDEVTAPTMMVLGRHDRLVPMDAAHATVMRRPDWDHVVFDDCGHTPMLEDPRGVINVIDAWLNGPASRLLTGRAGIRWRAASSWGTDEREEPA